MNHPAIEAMSKLSLGETWQPASHHDCPGSNRLPECSGVKTSKGKGHFKVEIGALGQPVEQCITYTCKEATSKSGLFFPQSNCGPSCPCCQINTLRTEERHREGKGMEGKSGRNMEKEGRQVSRSQDRMEWA